MANLAKKAMGLWDNLEKDAGLSFRWMSGLLNFGDQHIGEDSPEGAAVRPFCSLNFNMSQGTLTDPIENLKRLDMSFKER